MNGSRREFVDSNILVYAHDVSAGEKRDVARKLLGRLWEERCGCLSIQVLQEYAVNITRKVPKPLSLRETQDVITALSNWVVHSPSPAEVVAALGAQSRHKISFWDAMILVSARKLGCGIVWSEDLNFGQLYGGVEVRNPFAQTPSS